MIIPRPFLYLPKQKSKFYKDEVISRIESYYNVIYIRDSEILSKSYWWSGRYAIFYQPKPDLSKGHSHYMGVAIRDGNAYMSNGISATEPQVGIYHKHKFYYSTHNHDYVDTEDGDCSIDGGRHTRLIGDVLDKRFLCVSKDILYIK